MTPEEALAYAGEDRAVHFTEYLLTRTNKPSKAFRCGFNVFDEKMGGLKPGEVIVVTGHRKEGKTTFVESWMRSLMKTDPEAKSVIFSWEMSPEDLLQKYRYEPDLPLYLPLALKAMDFEWLKARCEEAKYKYNARIIVIDHLHFLVDMATKQNMSLNIGGFMRRLKQEISLGLKMAVILIAHQSQPKEGKEAGVDTLRDSTFIGQESDATITVMRRKNLDAADLQEYCGGDVLKEQLLTPIDENDSYSAQLATVKIDCHRRTGAWQWKKLFQKRGDFFEEV